jgi:hypothetical protein
MKNKLMEYLSKTLQKTHFNLSRVVELFLMMLALWWAIVLMLPTSTFSTSDAYLPMAMVASEGMWASYFLFISIVQWLGLWYVNKKTILSGLLLSMTTWMFIGTMMMIGSPASTGSGIYILISLLCASAYFHKGVAE